MYAQVKGNGLHSVNCHLHSESSDFLGGLRPVRHKSEVSGNILAEIFYCISVIPKMRFKELKTLTYILAYVHTYLHVYLCTKPHRTSVTLFGNLLWLCLVVVSWDREDLLVARSQTTTVHYCAYVLLVLRSVMTSTLQLATWC